MSTVLDTCAKIGQPIIEEMGYSLVDVEYIKEGKIYVLRYLVDSQKGIDIDECALISEKISIELDIQDPIEDEYVLEISSPGAERTLKSKDDIKKAINSYINVKLYAPINQSKEYVGDLIAFDGNILTLRYKVKNLEKTIEINYDQISKIRLAIKF